MPRDRLADAVTRVTNPMPGMFHLWPVNRFFANFAGTGGPIELMLRGAGVDPGGEAAFDAEIPAADFARLLRRTMRVSRDETCGLRPRPTPLGTFAQACRLAVGAGEIGPALRAAFRVYHGAIDDFRLRLSHAGDQYAITIVDTLPARPGRDMLHVVVLQMVRETIEWLSGRSGFVDQVELQFPTLPGSVTLEAMFRAPLVSQAARTRLVVDDAVLVCPIVADASEVASFVRSMPSKLALAFQDRRTVAERTASHLRAHGDWNIGRDEIAAALAMSPATLQRHLYKEVGVGFQDLKDQLRCTAAIKLLAGDHINLDHVAHRLGFAELSSFHRAFRRWTGQRPSSYRKREP